MTTATYATTVDLDGRTVTITASSPLNLDRAVAEARKFWTDTTAPARATVQDTLGATEVHTCQHGPMLHKTGESKTSGRPWSGWFCPLPRERRDEQCAPVWETT